MFDHIAHSYDQLNHRLSWNIDKMWRNAAIKKLAEKQPQTILDVATGTGDFAIKAAEALKPAKVANVSVPDPRTIAIRPWDKKAIRDIEKAIMDSDVGITPENNGEIIRLGIPQPTEERRKELVKQCNKIGEKTKVEVRNARSDVKEKLKKAIKDGLSEDLEKDAEAELQKIHDKYIKRVDDLLALKTKEIMTV